MWDAWDVHSAMENTETPPENHCGAKRQVSEKMFQCEGLEESQGNHCMDI